MIESGGVVLVEESFDPAVNARSDADVSSCRSGASLSEANRDPDRDAVFDYSSSDRGMRFTWNFAEDEIGRWGE
jgi:hypothetical protein